MGKNTFERWKPALLELVESHPGLTQLQYRYLLIERNPYYYPEYLRKCTFYALRLLVADGSIVVSEGRYQAVRRVLAG